MSLNNKHSKLLFLCEEEFVSNYRVSDKPIDR